jgi:NTE family protein
MSVELGVFLGSGGGLGAFDAGVLRHLVETKQTPFVITGMSMGALQAALFAGSNQPIDTLETFWATLARQEWPGVTERAGLALSAWGVPSFYRLGMPWEHGVYSLRPLRQLLLSLIDFDRLNRGPIRVVVPAMNLRTGHLEHFENQGPYPTWLTVDHLLANATLPVAFSPVVIEGEAYWDGGFFEHQPLGPLLARLTGDKHVIVSSLYRGEEPLPTTPMEASLRMVALMVRQKLQTSVALARQMQLFKGKAQLPDALEVFRGIKHFDWVESTDPNLTAGGLFQEAVKARYLAGYQAAQRLAFPEKTAAQTARTRRSIAQKPLRKR